ncbi:MAG: coenzyme F420 hydrogenase/dehydrogenase beta subunit N-terminal domain-containing protein [Chloroflexota bacterium]|nr:coenzyme F420 hydrogenase/dehydrogenase beta subunit N-terminal domain-containing protein [Chloroflexota bacterium]
MDNDTTIEAVVKKGLCTGCGTCVGICPLDAIEMTVDHLRGIYVPALDREECNECGMCVDVCPGHNVDFRQLNLEIFGKEPGDILLGNYLNCYTGYAADSDIRYNSASGGLVTALLIFALEEGLIDGALVTKMRDDRPLEPEPFIARTREEIISAARSKYCPVPANIAVKEILKAREGERFAVVGLPCHIHGIRNAERVNKTLAERIVLHVGLFCAHTDTFALAELVLQKHRIDKEHVASFDYRGCG